MDDAVLARLARASNPEHIALANRVRELLDRAGLLQRKAAP